MAVSKVGTNFHIGQKISVPLRTNYRLPQDGFVFACTNGSVNDDVTIYIDGNGITGARCNIQYKPESTGIFIPKGHVVNIGGSSPYDSWYYPIAEG